MTPPPHHHHHHVDTGITGVVTRQLTGGTISSPSQPYTTVTLVIQLPTCMES